MGRFFWKFLWIDGMGIFEDMMMKKIKNVGEFGVSGTSECVFGASEGVICDVFF